MTSNPFSVAPSELRSTPRALFRRPAILHLNDAQFLSARTVDISIEGICIMADISLQIGRSCAIEFNASFNQQTPPLRIEGKVAYCVLAGQGGFRIGFHLPGLPPTAKKYIEKIMSMQKF